MNVERRNGCAAVARRAALFGWLGLALLVAGRDSAASVTAGLYASGLNFPLFATAPPGDPRLFVVERAGRIRIISGGTLLPTPFLDIRSRVSVAGERGLLGLAFSPDHAVDGFFYIYYTNLQGHSVVSRFEVGSDPDLADAASEFPLLDPIPQPFANHNGGTVALSPVDGWLYFSPGDGGSANDPAERAQDPDDLLGKMLRIDVDGVLPAEIWALGLRNPYRFSFDRATGDLWIADVGQSQREEIDFQPASDPGGRNYGWDVMEGSLCNGVDPASSPPCNDPSLTLPVYEYAHSDGNCSITGGFLYRGAIPELWGHYVFGDYCSSRIWTLDPATGVATDRSQELGAAAAAPFELVGFGEDGSGELYVIHSGGEVFRIRSPDVECSDGLDNDGDGLIDLDDPDCTAEGDPLEAADADEDLVEDALDNCTQVANPSQEDTDGDDYGNVCDCDFDQNLTCNISDFNVFLPDFVSTLDSGVGTDMDSNGTVGIADFNLFLPGFVAGEPGPSGLVP
jgi:glucose/arabinose dehydrogenase